MLASVDGLNEQGRVLWVGTLGAMWRSKGKWPALGIVRVRVVVEPVSQVKALLCQICCSSIALGKYLGRREEGGRWCHVSLVIPSESGSLFWTLN